MSWFTDLAGRAEELLNKVDKSAAVVFNKDDEEVSTSSRISESRGHHYEREKHTLDSISSTNSSKFSPNAVTVGSPIRGDSTSRKFRSSTPNQAKTRTTLNETTDDKLFEFLNSGEPSKPMTISRPAPLAKIDIDPQLNTTQSSNTPTVALRKIPSSESVVSTIINEVQEVSSNSAEIAVTSTEEQIEMNATNVVSSDGSAPLNPRSLEFENQLFKKEISSLNQELNLSMERSKQQHSEMQKLNKEIEQHALKLSGGDKIVRELQNRESDLKQVLEAKDSQLAVLRIRLQEADLEIVRMRESSDKLQGENRRLLEDHSNSSDLHSQALHSLQQRLQQTEDIMERERCNFRSAQSENLQRIEKMEIELTSMTGNVNEAQSKLLEEKLRNTELHGQMKSLKQSAESSQQELADYKTKAQRILQSKDKLISSLKDVNNAGGSKSGKLEISAIEFEELQHERDDLKEDLLQSNQQISSLRSEIQEMETQMQDEVLLMRERIRELEKSVQEEREFKKEREREMLQLKEDMQYERESHNHQKTTLQSRIQDRDGEIEKLRNQLIAKQVNSTSQTELETRLSALTESLIQKQTMLEALSTEKSSLSLQLERMEHQTKDQAAAYVRRNATMNVNISDESDVRLRVPSFMVENPFDGQVTRKVKRVYNTIDTLSFRLGVFLRRYPMARVMIIIYMVMLHLWVLIVLLTYTPEAHPAEYLGGNNAHQ